MEDHQYTSQEMKIIFGLNQTTNEFQKQVEKSQWFARLRVRLEQEKVKLASFTPGQLDHSTKKDGFKKNLECVIKGEPGSRALLNIVSARRETVVDESARLNLFMFACFSLSADQITKIQQYGLVETFHLMLAAVIVDLSLPSALAKKFKAITKQVCGKDQTSTMLLELIKSNVKEENDQEVSLRLPILTHHGHKHGYEHGQSSSPEPGVKSGSEGRESFHNPYPSPPPNKKRVRQVNDQTDEFVYANIDHRKERKIPIMFSNVPSPNLSPLFGTKLLQALQAGNQWKHFKTECITFFISEDPTEDISINFRVGRDEGEELLKSLNCTQILLSRL